MRVGLLIGLTMWVGIAALTSGCSGVGIGGELGIYRIDERSQQSQTHNKKTGLRCLFVDCSGETQEVRGS